VGGQGLCTAAARVLLAGVDVVAGLINDVAAAGTDPSLFEELCERWERLTDRLTEPGLPCRVPDVGAAFPQMGKDTRGEQEGRLRE
jgi:hypothetical protein